MNRETTPARIVGFDFARALAILGMVLVNFRIAMLSPEDSGSSWSQWIDRLEGRAAATFVVLAGVGISLMAKRALATMDPAAIRTVRHTILKRSLFLLLVGLAYTPIWPADILHFYGVYLFIAAGLFAISNRGLLLAVALIPQLFVMLVFVFDYERGWNWEDLSYIGMWTWDGMFRHLFFNGFHPVIPWVTFVFAGMWLGRQNLRDPKFRRRTGIICFAIAMFIEGLSRLLLNLTKQSFPDADPELLNALLSTAAMPPMPWYIFAAGSLAIAVICLCVEFTEAFPQSWLTKLLTPTGQLALTHYVAHVLLGLLPMWALGMLQNSSGRTVVLASLAFFTSAVVFSVIWRRYFKRGPLEWVMRKLT